jgi:probable F420-dependent oxidoreductase
MTMKVRIGLGGVPAAADASGTAGAGLAELIDEAEAQGIDSLWLSDVVSSDQAIDPLIGLAYAAGRSEKIKLGTGVLVLPGRNPALVAAQLASLAALAPRRILPTFGVRPANSADRTMYPVSGNRRAAAFEEAFAVVRALLTEPSVTHHGEFFDLDAAAVRPRPTAKLDLWLSGRLPVGMERAGRLADGWLGSFITPDEARVCRGQIIDAARAAGRTIEEDHYGTNLLVAVDEGDYDDAVARVAGRRPDVAAPERLVCRGLGRGPGRGAALRRRRADQVRRPSSGPSVVAARLPRPVQQRADPAAELSDGPSRVQPSSAEPVEEGDHPLGQQRGRRLVVGRQAAIGEQMPVAGVHEQFGQRVLDHQGPGCVDVALTGEERVGVHAVDLRRHTGRPRATELRCRDAGVAQHGSACAHPGLGQHLGRQHPEREPGVDQPGRQRVGRGPSTLDDRAETDLVGMGDTGVEVGEGPTFVEVGQVHGVPGSLELAGEVANSGREPLCVVEQQYVGHGDLLGVRWR